MAVRPPREVRVIQNLWVGDECSVVEHKRGEWSHGVVVKLNRHRGTRRLQWVRLRFPDHTEKSYRPEHIRKVIPYRP